MGKSEKVGNRK